MTPDGFVEREREAVVHEAVAGAHSHNGAVPELIGAPAAGVRRRGQ